MIKPLNGWTVVKWTINKQSINIPFPVKTNLLYTSHVYDQDW